MKKTVTNRSMETIHKRQDRAMRSLFWAVVATVIMMCTAILFAGDLRAQVQLPEIELAEVKKPTLIDFTGKFIEGKVFLKWRVKGEKENGLFLVERSAGNKHFYPIAIKKGIGVPVETPMMYCFTDAAPEKGACRYRIFKMNENGTWYNSNAIQIEVPYVKGQGELQSSNPVPAL